MKHYHDYSSRRGPEEWVGALVILGIIGPAVCLLLITKPDSLAPGKADRDQRNVRPGEAGKEIFYAGQGEWF